MSNPQHDDDSLTYSTPHSSKQNSEANSLVESASLSESAQLSEPGQRSVAAKGTPKQRQPVTTRQKLIGIMAGVGASVGYTATNIFLRSATDVDPWLVSWTKAIWTVIIFGPWLAYLATSRVQILPRRSAFVYLCLVACLAQLGGNVCFQWCLGVLGLAITVAVVMGAMLIGSMLLGIIFLREHVRSSTIIAIFIMLAAIASVSWGLANQSSEGVLSDSQDSNLGWVLIGLIPACLCGLSYAMLGISIRNAMKDRIPLASPMIVMGAAGCLILGAVVLLRGDAIDWAGVSITSWLWMSLAGIANALAFLALTLSLKLIPVAYVNAINASQVAMAAAAGIALFGELLTFEIGIGISLTVLGFCILNFSGMRQSFGKRQSNSSSHS